MAGLIVQEWPDAIHSTPSPLAASSGPVRSPLDAYEVREQAEAPKTDHHVTGLMRSGLIDIPCAGHDISPAADLVET